MSQALRMINPIAAQNKCAVMFINQIRHKIWVMHWSNEVTTWGRALDFYSTQRLRISRKSTQSWQIKEEGENIWTPTFVEVVKNKVGKPFERAEFNILYGKGIDKAWELGDLLIEAGHITGRYKINEEKIANNSNELRKYIKENYKDLKEIYINSWID
jgi:recombination protein RecA